jgi:hypothetical protein
MEKGEHRISTLSGAIDDVIADGRGKGGRYGLGAHPGLRHGDGGPGAAGAERISGRRIPVWSKNWNGRRTCSPWSVASLPGVPELGDG